VRILGAAGVSYVGVTHNGRVGAMWGVLTRWIGLDQWHPAPLREGEGNLWIPGRPADTFEVTWAESAI